MNANRTYAQEFLGGMSPAGRRVQQTLSPADQYRVSGYTRPRSQRQGLQDPVAAFESLDPADDGFIEKSSFIFEGADPTLVSDPRVASSIRQKSAQHAEAQAYFKKDPRLAQFYAEQRAQNIAPDVALGALRSRAQDDSTREEFLKAGGLDEEFETFRDPSTGQVDRFKALSYLNKFERDAKRKVAAAPKELTAEGYNRLLSAEDALAAAEAEIPADEQTTQDLKIKAFQKQYGKGRKPATEQEWDQAFDLAYPNVRKNRERLESLKKSYGSRYVLPPEFQDPQAAPVETQETVVEASPEGSIMEGVQSVVPALPGAVEPPIAEPAPNGYLQPTPTPVAVPSPAKTDSQSQQKPTGIQQEDRASFLSRQKGKK